MYADKITASMQQTIDETNRRRNKQRAYNVKHNITPTAIIKDKTSALGGYSKQAEAKAYIEPDYMSLVADPILVRMSNLQLQKAIDKTRKSMYESARRLEFPEAAHYRDELMKLELLLKSRE